MYLKNVNKSYVTRYSILLLKIIAVALFLFCFYQAAKISS